MARGSLAGRLLLAAALWTSLVLVVAGFALSSYYNSAVERSFDQRLDVYLKVLVGELSRNRDAANSDLQVGEPRFDLPLSGWYWQIERRGGPTDKPDMRVSRSLFDRTLGFLIDMDPEKDAAATRVGYVTGPDGEQLRQVERVINFPDARYIVAVAGDASEITEETDDFDSALITAFFLLGLGLVLTAAIPVAYGLRPLARISREIAAVRAGRRSRLSDKVPREISPLIRELNGLIESNREIVERARTQVGNLAHALKTPLSVIINEAGTAKGALAGKVQEQATIMRTQIEHHLDRARIAAGVPAMGASVEATEVVRALVRTMEKVHRDRHLVFDVSVDPVAFRGERQDLEEMVGNLVDNACKWAKSAVSVALVAEGREWLRVIVDDDGDGLTPAERQAVLERGQRLDESKPGSGLGLAIVSDLAGLYGGSLALASSSSGGLRAILRLPRTVEMA